MVKLSDILKDGAEWKPPVIDMNDPEVIALIERTKKAQAECLALKKIDWNRMRMVINI